MNIALLAQRAERLIVDNSPIILTTFGVVGTVTTAYLTGKASIKAEHILEDAQVEIWKNHPNATVDPLLPSDVNFTFKEKFLLTWKCYIPPAGALVLTCGAIIGANHIGSRRAAAVAAAYSITEKAFSEYKDKVMETLGEKKEQHIRDEIAQERIEINPLGDRTIIIEGIDVLCYDMYTDRWFKSDMETIKKAVNDTNYQINNSMYASLTEFYSRLGLPRTSFSDDVGWNCDKQLEVEFSTCISPDQKPALAISFRADPIKGYSRLL